MKIIATNKSTFDTLMEQKGITNNNVEENSNTFFISINDTQGTHEVPYFENKKNVKVIYFDDVEEDIDHPKYGLIKAFTEGQAKERIDFIEQQYGKEKCIVHCSAGISRSGAVATFINDYFGEDYFEFMKQNPYVLPNGLVLRLLRREFFKRNNHSA